MGEEMAVKSPEDVEGREIPLDTAKSFGAGGNAHNITQWIHTTDFYAGNDVFGRIADPIDRGGCENEMGACGNGFECPACGCGVGDEGHCHVGGTWNFRPHRGREAVDHAH